MSPDLMCAKRLLEAGAAAAAAAVLVKTAIATSSNPIKMAEAFSLAVRAGTLAYMAKLGEENSFAVASSPLTGFLHEGDK